VEEFRHLSMVSTYQILHCSSFISDSKDRGSLGPLLSWAFVQQSLLSTADKGAFLLSDDPCAQIHPKRRCSSKVPRTGKVGDCKYFWMLYKPKGRLMGNRILLRGVCNGVLNGMLTGPAEKPIGLPWLDSPPPPPRGIFQVHDVGRAPVASMLTWTREYEWFRPSDCRWGSPSNCWASGSDWNCCCR
jgi:hypothetical protein